MYTVLLLLSALSVSQPDWITIATSQERCAMTACSTEVTTSRPKLEKVPRYRTYATSLHYQEDRYIMTRELQKEVDTFMEIHKNQRNFMVVGYTDGCGDHAYNKELSRKRAREISTYIKTHYAGVSIRMKWVGEASGEHTIAARRVDVVTTKKYMVTDVPPKIIGDFYLLDASGSMNGEKWLKWKKAVSYWRPRGARVFVTTSGHVARGSHLDHIQPYGGTEIWFAYWSILDKMKPGQKLVIISDFDSEVSLSPHERAMIEQKVRSKGVRVQAVAL